MASATGGTSHHPQLEKRPFLMYPRERGNRCVGMLPKEGQGHSEPKATNPRTINEKWLSSLVSMLLRIYS